MTTQHTPGPWIWTDGVRPIDIKTYQSPGHHDNPTLFGGLDLDTWVVGDGEYWAVGPVGPEAEAIANCHLIAAAPDLLAVLCEMLGAAETDLLDDKSNVWRSAMNDARTAIAKAKGE